MKRGGFGDGLGGGLVGGFGDGLGNGLVGAVVVGFALVAACSPEDDPSREALTREAFVEAYVALGAAGLQAASRVISPEERNRILAERGIDAEALLEFAESHGHDAAFMKEVWDEVESRLEERRAESDLNR